MITLRDYIEETVLEWNLKYGESRNQYFNEAIVYTIMDYHSCKGSVLDFTEDDWKVCQEYGWSVDEVVELCETDEYHCNCCGTDFCASELYLDVDRQNWSCEICCPNCGASYEQNDEYTVYVERWN